MTLPLVRFRVKFPKAKIIEAQTYYNVMDEDKASDDEALTSLNSVDTCIDID